MRKIIAFTLFFLASSEAHALFLRGGGNTGGGVLLQPITAEDALSGLTGEDGTTILTVE